MAKMPNPDLFRDYVTLQTLSRKSDGLGGAETTWTNTATFWAKVEPMSASQRLFSRRLEQNTTHKIYTRYRSDIDVTIDQRISWNNRLFQVQGVIDIDERRRFIEIECVEGKAS